MAGNSNKDLNTRAQLLKEIEERNSRIDKTVKNTAINQDLLNRYTEKQSKVQVKLIAELKEINKTRLEGLSQAEQSIQSMSSMYSNLSSLEKERIINAAKLKDGQDKMTDGQRSAFNEMASINQKIAGLTDTDIAQKIELDGQYAAQLKKVQDMGSIGEEMHSNLKKQNTEAEKFASMSAESKEILQGQHDVLDGISKTINGTLSTAKTLYGNLQGAIGGVITGLGVVVSKIGQANMELGTSMSQTDGVARSAGVLSFIFDDAVQSARDLSSELGGTDKATFGLQANVGLISTNMGISGTEASKLIGSFSRLNGNSTDVASDMVKTSQEFAKQNNIIPAQLMSDLANSTEEFALFGKAGGENILRAAGYAAKLGVSMSTMGGIAEGLLDFESSITKELELGVMLGRNINLNKARELAYNDDIEGAVKETMKQLGGVAAFNKMDYYQKKQTADLLGISVGELKKMNSNMESAGKLSGVVSQTFSKWGESLSAVTNKYLGVGLSTMGGWVTSSAQIAGNFGNMGFKLGDMVKSIAKGAKNLASKGWQMLQGGGASKSIAGALSKKQIAAGFGGKAAKDKLLGIGKTSLPDTKGITKGAGGNIGGKGGIMKSMGKIKISSVLKGAAAMVLVAGAVYILGKAVQEFKGVGIDQMAMVGLGIIGLAAAVMLVGLGGPMMIVGAIAMLIVAAAVLVLGHALQAIGTGFEMMGAGISTLMPTLATVSSSIMGMVTMIAPIALLSYALLGLSASLMGLGIAMAFLGIAGLPGLMMLAGIAAVSTPIIKLAEFFGLGSSDETGGLEKGSLSTYETNMLSKMDQLIVATTRQRDIYLDKDKVTNIVMDRGERSAVNKFQLNRA